MGKKNELLLDSKEILIVQTRLARLIGLNPAIAIQQIHYWVEINAQQGKKTHYHDGLWWCYNTWKEWHERDFPFWSMSTIRRIFCGLESEALIVTRPHKNRNSGLWATVNYGQLEVVQKEAGDSGKVNRPKGSGSAQNEQTSPAKMNRPSAQNEQTTSDPDTNHETTSENKSITPSGVPEAPTEVIWLPGDDPIFDQPEVTAYPCTGQDINDLIAAWWEWVPSAPVKRGRVEPVSRHFANKSNRDYAESLVQRGVAPADFARCLNDIRNGSHPRSEELLKKELTFCYIAPVVESWVQADREENIYSPDSPRVTPRKPGITINLGELVEGDNVIARLQDDPMVYVDIPQPYLTPHQIESVSEPPSDADGEAALLAELGIDL